jgi:hypothetical protein
MLASEWAYTKRQFERSSFLRDGNWGNHFLGDGFNLSTPLEMGTGEFVS